MLKVVIIGSGNVARHLYDAISASSSVAVVQVVGRNPKTLAYFENHTAVTTEFGKIIENDICIIAVNDDAIQAVSEAIPKENGIIVHTSGNTPLGILSQHGQHGVLYPLQTLRSKRGINFKSVPVCLEANTPEGLIHLKELGDAISDQVYVVDSERRKKLHLAAVFVNNFSNHLFYIGNAICQENNLDFKMLVPLIHETCLRIDTVSPYDAQTGPARRGDKGTLEGHLQQLDNSSYKTIYSILSQSIQTTYGKEL